VAVFVLLGGPRSTLAAHGLPVIYPHSYPQAVRCPPGLPVAPSSPNEAAVTDREVAERRLGKSHGWADRDAALTRVDRPSAPLVPTERQLNHMTSPARTAKKGPLWLLGRPHQHEFPSPDVIRNLGLCCAIADTTKPWQRKTTPSQPVDEPVRQGHICESNGFSSPRPRLEASTQ
jgi:hypothetical protein